jgi:hypothetical protein
MFRPVPLSIIRSFSLYTQQCYDDGQRNYPKPVEFHSKNKFEKLLHLVGFIIRNLFILLTLRDQPTAHTLGVVAVGSEKRYLPDKKGPMYMVYGKTPMRSWKPANYTLANIYSRSRVQPSADTHTKET